MVDLFLISFYNFGGIGYLFRRFDGLKGTIQVVFFFVLAFAAQQIFIEFKQGFGIAHIEPFVSVFVSASDNSHFFLGPYRGIRTGNFFGEHEIARGTRKDAVGRVLVEMVGLGFRTGGRPLDLALLFRLARHFFASHLDVLAELVVAHVHPDFLVVLTLLRRDKFRHEGLLVRPEEGRQAENAFLEDGAIRELGHFVGRRIDPHELVGKVLQLVRQGRIPLHFQWNLATDPASPL